MQKKEERIEECFNRNITATEPPTSIPLRRGAPEKPKTAKTKPSYSRPTASSEAHAKAAVSEMQNHLARRGKRLTQLFLHADRDRSGTLDSEEVAGMLRSANIPDTLTEQFMNQIDHNKDGQVTMDEFARALADNGYSSVRSSNVMKPGMIDKRMWASRAFLQQEEELADLSKKEPTEAQQRRNRGTTRNASRGKHGAWDHRDPNRPVDEKHDTTGTFHSRPFYTCDRQVHAWQQYHVQPNPITMNRAHPAHPPYATLSNSNHLISFGRGDTPKATKARPQSALPATVMTATNFAQPGPPPRPRPASAISAKKGFADVDRFEDKRIGFRNVWTGVKGEDRDHVIPNATLWTCTLARRQVRTPEGIHNNARTVQERNFAKDPSVGMRWSRTEGWGVSPIRPSVDERFVQATRS